MKRALNKIIFNWAIILITTIFTIFFSALMPILACNNAHAETSITRYYLITQNTIMLTRESKIDGNIQLSATYYVQATSTPDIVINDVNYRNVIYNGINGLVESSALSKKTINNISNPFFKSKNKLTANSNTGRVQMLFEIDSASFNGIFLPDDTKLEFIAYSLKNEYVLAKLSDNTIGFVLESYCTPKVVFTPHPNPINPDIDGNLPDLSPGTPNDATNQNKNASITRIIIIVTLCVIAVIIVFLLFKPVSGKKKSSAKDDFYDYQ